jgi:hypothetical protein
MESSSESKSEISFDEMPSEIHENIMKLDKKVAVKLSETSKKYHEFRKIFSDPIKREDESENMYFKRLVKEKNEKYIMKFIKNMNLGEKLKETYKNIDIDLKLTYIFILSYGVCESLQNNDKIWEIILSKINNLIEKINEVKQGKQRKQVKQGDQKNFAQKLIIKAYLLMIYHAMFSQQSYNFLSVLSKMKNYIEITNPIKNFDEYKRIMINLKYLNDEKINELISILFQNDGLKKIKKMKTKTLSNSELKNNELLFKYLLDNSKTEQKKEKIISKLIPRADISQEFNISISNFINCMRYYINIYGDDAIHIVKIILNSYDLENYFVYFLPLNTDRYNKYLDKNEIKIYRAINGVKKYVTSDIVKDDELKNICDFGLMYDDPKLINDEDYDNETFIENGCVNCIKNYHNNKKLIEEDSDED